MKFTLYFVRHGETFLNKFERMQGWSDSPLTSKGLEDMKKLGQKLNDIEFNRIITSDLSRSINSAKAMFEDKNEKLDKLEIYEEFRETFFGGFEGEKNQVAWDTVCNTVGANSMHELVDKVDYAQLPTLFHEADSYKSAETKEDLYIRLQYAKDIILSNVNESDNVLLISHGNFMRHFIYMMTGQLFSSIDNSSCLKCTCEFGNGLKITEVEKI